MQAIECLQHGLPVFCEKPLATDASDTLRVLAAAQQADRLLGVDYCYRHVSGMDALRQHIAGGDLGQLSAIELQFHNAYGPDKRWCFDRGQAGGGCLLDLGSHLLDLSMWLLPGQAWRLTGQHRYCGGKLLPPRDLALEDLAFVELTSDSGMLVRIACSWYAHLGCDAHIEMQVRGAKGGATWRNVGGSFYDFELDLHRGTSRSRLSSSPDDWGSRALVAWLEQLRISPRFDASDAMGLRQGASIIDEVYSK
jgi:predicted dehydrogenase